MPQKTIHDSRFTIYALLRPLLFSLPPETAHEFALESLRFGLGSRTLQEKFAAKYSLSPFGAINCFGIQFKNPIGVAAGFDKNAVVTSQLAALGFGFVEVGTTTFHAQPGNPKPRLFRLPLDKALINRAGFNNEGTAKVVERLKKNRPPCVLGMNIGKSKIVPNEEAVEDYLKSFELVHGIADYIVVNVSSPNTPNLRELQKADALDELLSALQKHNQVLSAAFRRQSSEKPPEGGTQNKSQNKPLLVKIAPDLSIGEIEAICDVALKLNLAGIVATNTTIARDDLKMSQAAIEKIGAGGLSGAPVRAKSTEVIKTIYKFTKGKLPIIGVGGVFTAEDAFEKIAAGASLVQLYTGFIYQGYAVARDINIGLSKILEQRGLNSYQEAIGVENQN